MGKSKDKEPEIEWDKKKVVVGIILVVLLLGIVVWLKPLFLDDNTVSEKETTQKQQTKGLTIQEASEDLRKSLQEKIQGLQTDAQNLDVAEVASSSPQVQKVLNDLRSLKDLPKTQLKDACEKVCGGL